MRRRLVKEAARLDLLLGSHGIAVDGGASLFRHVAMPDAPGLFQALGQSGIIVRNFAGRPYELRFGLPGSEGEWARLEQALATWAQAHGSLAARAGASR